MVGKYAWPECMHVCIQRRLGQSGDCSKSLKANGVSNMYSLMHSKHLKYFKPRGILRA